MTELINETAVNLVRRFISKHAAEGAKVTVTALELKDVTATAGGMSMMMLKGVAKVTVDGTPINDIPLVVKATRDSDSSRATTKQVGLNREARFARDMALQKLICPDTPQDTMFPFFIGAHNDDEVGSKVVVMGDLTLNTAAKLNLPDGTPIPFEARYNGVQAGYFFGGTSVHNWGKDLAAITAGFPGVTERDVSIRAASEAANLHGNFWRVSPIRLSDLKDPEADVSGERPWLRASDWILKGENQASYQIYTDLAVNAWKKFLAANETNDVKVAPQLAAMMDVVLGNSSFQRFTELMHKGPCGYTIVHGDFHPANTMVVSLGEGKWDLVLLDWEVVGVGSGPQELGQFLISHTSPASRGPYFKEMVSTYVRDFTATVGPDTVAPSEADITHELVYGGLGRWVWLLAYIAGSGAPAVVTQFFHDQVWHFMEEHGVLSAEAFNKIVLRV